MRQAETTEHVPRRWRPRVDHVVAAVILCAVSFRLVALPIALLWLLTPPSRSRACRWGTAAALVVVLAIPVDIGLPGVVHVEGRAGSGVRLVRLNGTCMPARTDLTRRYGEFVVATWPCFYQPVYLVVWR